LKLQSTPQQTHKQSRILHRDLYQIRHQAVEQAIRAVFGSGLLCGQQDRLFNRWPNQGVGFLIDINDFGKLKEAEVEPIFKAFTALPEEQQADMEVDFQDINALVPL